CQQHNEYPPTF
nr:immunoglobulin light chain junction region [Macaca mulatta]MOV84460.1 immunoglobulin light chain junction region [Macaca mulatta]